MEPIKRYSRTGLTIEVGERAITISERRAFRTNVTVLPLATIASVRNTGLTHKDIEIVTNSGERHKYMIGREGAALAAGITAAL
jgi:hypothetical protein